LIWLAAFRTPPTNWHHMVASHLALAARLAGL
jgi:hypothetical protein